MMKNVFGLLLTGFVLSLVSGCTANKNANHDRKLKFGIFADRPVDAVENLYVFTFESPALLSTATKVGGKWVISDSAKTDIETEQNNFIASLSAIDPNAKVVYRYRMTVNGLAIYVDGSSLEKLANLPNIKNITHVLKMDRPAGLNIKPAQASENGESIETAANSVNFIGADKVHKLGFTGKGMRVGVIDTGIDYTHSMLGGPGTVEAFESVDPALPSNFFPNKKVVGGIDLVGSDFDSSAADDKGKLPLPDANPIDEAGHGSHVSGTIAGIGDNMTTYSGVAPDATLYAIKVFGKAGTTIDAAVIGGFEFAVDPNGDLDIDDQLDVINLSLGGGFGQPQFLYTEAVNNLTKAGMIVVCSAGNSGDVSYIVGAPSTADSAISVAASIDNADINWRFDASQISSATNPKLMVRALEGPVSLPVKQADGISGELVDIGFADAELSDDLKAKLKGKVALIQRGKNPFADKLKFAQAGGAIGALVYNNSSEEPIQMGGEGHVDIPAIMVSQALGLEIIQQLKTEPVRILFKTGEFIESAERIDTITSFSSRGPRSVDNLFKPEIAAPGQNITSAESGSGNKGILMDGTSMAGPHMAGAMTLIKQAKPGLESIEYKSLAMNTAKNIGSNTAPIAFTAQGAGRIQLFNAVRGKVVTRTPAISLGRIQLENTKVDSREITLKNITGRELALQISTTSMPGLTIKAPTSVTLPALGEATIVATFEYTLVNEESFVMELDGRINFSEGKTEVMSIPAMGIRTQASHITIEPSKRSGIFILSNSSPVSGFATAFNLLGEDKRKDLPAKKDAWMGRNCDLRTAGYRIIRTIDNNQVVEYVQFAFRVHSPVTTWTMCSLSVLFDNDGDSIADQELASTHTAILAGVEPAASSMMLDSKIARSIRVKYETDFAAGDLEATPDYKPAVLGAFSMAAIDQSTFAMLEVPASLIKLTADGKIRLKVAAQAEDGANTESDDYLGDGLGNWFEISPRLEDQPAFGMTELTPVDGNGSRLVIQRGPTKGKLVLYMPFNEYIDREGSNGQEQIVEL